MRIPRPPADRPLHIRTTFSVGLVSFGGHRTGIYCIWLLISELTQPGVIRMPIDPQTAAAAAQNGQRQTGRPGSGSFAAIFGPKPDTRLQTCSGKAQRTTPTSPSHLRWRVIDWIKRSVTHRPTPAFGCSSAGFAAQFKEVTEALRMSYFTGPSDMSLMPIRTFIAAQMPTLDADMQQLARRDVRLLLTHQQKSAIIQAYHVATTTGKRLIDQELNERDPNFAQALRRGAE